MRTTGPSIDALLADALERLDKDLTDKCAKAVGAKDANDALTRLGSENVGYGDLGQIAFTDGVSVGGPLANTSNSNNRITFNTEVNWYDPSNSSAMMDGTLVSYNLLTAKTSELNREFGVSGSSTMIQQITAKQLMDLTLLHELAHTYGQNYDNRDYILWQNCF